MKKRLGDTTPDAINEARPEGAGNTYEPLTETSTSGGASMADNGQYTDSASGNNPEQNGTWQSIGQLARALAEKSGSK